MNRDNSATAYGPVPNLEDTRNEGFAKVTLTPTHNTLFNVSYRDSHELEKASGGFSAFEAGTAGSGAESWQRIGNADGSWIINNNNFATFKYTHFSNPTQGVPDNVSSATVNTAIGTHLPIDRPRVAGTLHGPQADRRQRRAERVRAADHQSVRLSPERRPAGRRHRRLRLPPDRPGQLRPERRPVRLQHDACRPAACATTCTSAISSTWTRRI